MEDISEDDFLVHVRSDGVCSGPESLISAFVATLEKNGSFGLVALTCAFWYGLIDAIYRQSPFWRNLHVQYALKR